MAWTWKIIDVTDETLPFDDTYGATVEIRNDIGNVVVANKTFRFAHTLVRAAAISQINASVVRMKNAGAQTNPLAGDVGVVSSVN